MIQLVFSSMVTLPLVLIAAGSARGVTLTPLLDDRHVTTRSQCGTSICSSISRPDVPFQDWSFDLPQSVSQDSTVDALGMGGTGFAFAATPSNAGLYSDSIFNVRFSIDEPAGVHLTASFEPNGVTVGIFTLFRDTGSEVAIQTFSSPYDAPSSFVFDGYLPAGIYRLGGGGVGDNGASMTWHVRLDLTPVPEPGVLGLSGLAALSLLRRRR